MEGKRPAIRYIIKRSISGRYLSWRAVTVHWRSITSRSVAREKAPQNTPLRAVRSMRAVLRDAY
jgi:hypothetical protein